MNAQFTAGAWNDGLVVVATAGAGGVRKPTRGELEVMGVGVEYSGSILEANFGTLP